MSSNDAVGATREALTTLAAAVLRVRNEYGDKVRLRPGQVPLVTDPDTDVFKLQAQVVW